MADHWRDATTGLATTGDPGADERRFLHVTLLMTPDLARVGATAALGSRGLSLDRGALAIDGEPIEDGLMSRQQGVIRAARGGGFELVDQGSRNGTWLNGARVAAGEPVPLAAGDRVQVGHTILYIDELPPDPDGWERDLARRRLGRSGGARAGADAEERALAEVHGRLGREALVGATLAWRTTRRDILAAARLEGAVLVTGPTGTGKEAVAAAVHAASARRRGPFVAFSSAEVAPSLVVSELFGAVRGAYTGAERDRVGLWRTAAHGTLFLDEIGDAPPELQAALLRAIESGQVRPVGATESITVDVRLVAATKRDLEAEVAAGRFRDDLLFRLAGTHIRLGALAERPADALLLFAAGLRRFGRTTARASVPVVEALWRHGWPGNGREVMHLCERVVADLGADGEIHLPVDLARAESGARPDVTGPEPGREPKVTRGRAPRDADELRDALGRHGGNVAAVAREYDVRRQQVYRWVERFGVTLDAAREADERDEG